MKSETIRDTGELLNCTRRSPNDFKCYRGQCDASWSLIPSFYRGLDEFQPPPTDLEDGEWLGALERDVYREFELKGRRFASRKWEFHNPWHRLIFAQHYGLPTRLLDWSKSALIAAYFAVNSHPDQDGALWCINVSAMPFPSALGRRMKTAGFRLAQLDACVTRDRLSFLWPVSLKIVEETASPAAQAIASDQNGDSERDGFLVVIERWCLPDEAGHLAYRPAFRRGRQLGRHSMSRPTAPAAVSRFTWSSGLASAVVVSAVRRAQRSISSIAATRREAAT